MSENTPNTNTGFDETDPRGEEFFFPGTERDDLTEEEKEFTFDEDYLDADFPPVKKDEPAPEESSDAVDALASAFRVRQQKEQKAQQDRADKIDAVFDAFKKRTAKTEEPSEPSAEEKEDEVFAAFSKIARQDRPRAASAAIHSTTFFRIQCKSPSVR